MHPPTSGKQPVETTKGQWEDGESSHGDRTKEANTPKDLCSRESSLLLLGSSSLLSGGKSEKNGVRHESNQGQTRDKGWEAVSLADFFFNFMISWNANSSARKCSLELLIKHRFSKWKDKAWRCGIINLVVYFSPHLGLESFPKTDSKTLELWLEMKNDSLRCWHFFYSSRRGTLDIG